MTNETWGLVREDLIKRIGKNNYVTWIEPLTLSDLAEGVARFEVPTVFFGDWVSRNFADHIRAQIALAGVTVDRVEFSVAAAPQGLRAAGSVAARPEPVPRPEPRASITRRTPVMEDDLRGAPLDARFTFDSFVVGKPNELAHAASRRVAEGGPVTFNPLFL